VEYWAIIAYIRTSLQLKTAQMSNSIRNLSPPTPSPTAAAFKNNGNLKFQAYAYPTVKISGRPGQLWNSLLPDHHQTVLEKTNQVLQTNQ